MFLVLLKEMRMLSEPKILSFLFLMQNNGMRRWGVSRISLCNPGGGKLQLRPSLLTLGMG